MTERERLLFDRINEIEDEYGAQPPDDKQDKKLLLDYLRQFGRLPFIKADSVTPDLLTRVVASSSIYLYWVN